MSRNRSNASTSRIVFFRVWMVPTERITFWRRAARSTFTGVTPCHTTWMRLESTPSSSFTWDAVKCETAMMSDARAAASRACRVKRLRNSALEYSPVSTNRS